MSPDDDHSRRRRGGGGGGGALLTIGAPGVGSLMSRRSSPPTLSTPVLMSLGLHNETKPLMGAGGSLWAGVPNPDSDQ